MSQTAKLFWSGRSQAVRLPKKFRMEGTEVRIRQYGRGLLLEPVETDWKWLDSVAGGFSEDFFEHGRQQPGLPTDENIDSAFK